MKNSLETRLGLFFALVVVAAFILFEFVGAQRYFTKTISIRTRFKTAGDIKAGDPVKLAGVDIGTVRTVRIAEGKVEVLMDINSIATKEVHTDSKASIKFTGLMGQNFIAIDFGSSTSPVITANSMLEPLEQPDLAAIMAKLETAAEGIQNMTKSFTGEDFGKLLGPLTELVKDNQPRIASILGNLENLTTSLNEGKGTLGPLLNEDTLYSNTLLAVTNLMSTTDDLKLTLADTRRVINGLNEGKGTMGRLLADESLFREATNMMTHLRQISEKMNRGNGTVGQLINDDAFLRNPKLTLQKVERATETLEDAGPLQVIGTAAGSIF